MSKINVLAIAASTWGFRDERFNDDRTDALRRLIEQEKPRGGVVLVPAGYWTVPTSSRVAEQTLEIAHQLRPLLAEFQCTLFAGIDVTFCSDPKTRYSKRDYPPPLPFFGFAVSPDGSVAGPWRQLSATASDTTSTPLDRCREVVARTISVSDVAVLPLLCGEMHNARIRHATKDEKPALVVVSGHASLGQGLVGAVRAMHDASGGPVVHVQHLAPSTGASIHWISRAGVSGSALVGPLRNSNAPFWLAPFARPHALTQ